MVVAKVPHVATRGCECRMNALRIGSSHSIRLGVENCAVDWPASVPFFVETSIAMSARDKNEGKRNEID
jgi:hypothetical protein